MKKFNLINSSIWGGVLVISVFFAVFVLPVMPVDWHRWIFRAVYSIIYISAIFSLEKRSKKLFTLFLTTFLIEWISAVFDFEIMYDLARGMNILFFTVIIIMLIRQIAIARDVTAGVILGSITGYLLLGLIYSIFVTLIMKTVPGSYSNLPLDPVTNQAQIDTSVPLYYSFVTIASLGYGDICPLKPLSRSLATIITVSGQFYIAIIVALLVGKFSSQRTTTPE